MREIIHLQLGAHSPPLPSTNDVVPVSNETIEKSCEKMILMIKDANDTVFTDVRIIDSFLNVSRIAATKSKRLEAILKNGEVQAIVTSVAKDLDCNPSSLLQAVNGTVYAHPGTNVYFTRYIVDIAIPIAFKIDYTLGYIVLSFFKNRGVSILKEVHFLKDDIDRPGWIYLMKMSLVDGSQAFMMGFTTSFERKYINELTFAYPDSVFVFDMFVDSIEVFYTVKEKLNDFVHIDLTLYYVFKDLDLSLIKMSVIHEANNRIMKHAPKLE